MKSERQIAILEIIANQQITTQAQLTEALQKRGIVTTQATVSRDIKEMRLAKIMSENGSYKYAVAEMAENEMSNRLRRILSDSLMNISTSGCMVVIHTLAAAAGAAAETLDALRWPEVLGTIAGDNTVFLVVREDVDARVVVERINDLIS